MPVTTRSALQCQLKFSELLQRAKTSEDGDSDTEQELDSDSEESPTPGPVGGEIVQDWKRRLSCPVVPSLVFISSPTTASSLPSSPTAETSMSSFSTAMYPNADGECDNVVPRSLCPVDSNTSVSPLRPSVDPPFAAESHSLKVTPSKRPAESASEGGVPKKQSKANEKRREKRIRSKAAAGHTHASNTVLRRTILAASQLPATINAKDFRIAYGAYRGVNSKPYGAQVRYSIERLLGMGFQLIEWDGVTPVAIVDNDHRIFAILAGRPGGQEYVQACMRMHSKFVELKKRITWDKSEKKHKRGKFVALNTGIAFDKGQTQPKRLGDKRQVLIQELLDDSDVQRVASYQDSILARYFPKIYALYRSYMADLKEKLPEEHVNFRLSVFAAAAFNLGPDVWTWLHKDSKNYPGGECLITSLGPFDPTRSGLLILWELKMLIQFPSASTVGIPSAAITHSNTPVVDGDERSSFTQYTPGGIFRWLDNGGRTDLELRSEDLDEFLRLKEQRGSRWEEALRRFSTLTELLSATSGL